MADQTPAEAREKLLRRIKSVRRREYLMKKRRYVPPLNSLNW